MAGEAVPAADVSWHGLAGDRRWAFVQERLPRSGFPWLTIRERSDMVAFRPRFAEPEDPDETSVLVRTPDGCELDVTDPGLAEELGGGLVLLKQDRGSFDAMSLSLVSTGTLDWLAEASGTAPDARRLRPSLVVEAEPLAELAWVGKTLTIGGLRFRVDRRDQRCVVVNVDPDTARRDPAVLRAIAREQQSFLGVYGSIVAPGRVAVGDDVVLS